jgi:hypothetical protein
MAGVRNSTQRREVNIGAGMDTSAIATAVQQITGSLKGLTAEIQNISRSTANSIEPMQRSFKKVADTSGLAGASIMGMTGIIQDSNYGIRGMANNIQFVVPLLSQLVTQTGSLSGAFKSLWSSLMGPLGVMMAFSTGIAILERYSMRKKEVAKETEKVTKTVKDNHAEALILLERLKDLNISEKDRIDILKDLKEKHGVIIGQYKTEEERIIALNIAHQDLMKSMLAEANMSVYTDKMKLSAEQVLIYKNSLKALRDELKTNQDVIEDMKSKDQDLTFVNQRQVTILSEITKLEGQISWEKEKQNRLGQAATTASKDILEGIKPQKVDPKPEIDANKKRVQSIKSSQAEIMDLLKPRQDQNKELYNQMLKGSEEGLDFFYFNGKLSMNNYGKGIQDGTKQVGPIIQNSTEFIKSEYQKSFEKLSEQMKAMLQTYIVDVVVSIGDLIGQALVMGGDAFKGSKDEMLKGFADFLGKFGALLIAFGVASSAFWESMSKPSPATSAIAITAGIAAVVAAGAIKGYLKKQANSNNIGSIPSPSGGGSMGSSGYSNNEMYMYSRLDGRDLVLSNQRAVYQQRR